MFIDQSKIHAPCINPHTVNGSIFFRFDNSLLDLKELPECIPVHRSVYDNRIIRKAVDLFHLYFPIFQGAENCPSTGSTKIKCQNIMCILIFHPVRSFLSRFSALLWLFFQFVCRMSSCQSILASHRIKSQYLFFRKFFRAAKHFCLIQKSCIELQ